jgi:LPXTG-site transpeptidase (sortase) family protein
MHRVTKKQLSNLKVFWIDASFVVALIATLLIVVFFMDRLPPQDAAVVVPIPANVTCSPTEGIQRLPVYDQYPEPGDKVGTITLESLDLSWPIIEGTEEAQLSQGVGHYIGSVLPGIYDNSILSGHRSTVFGRLGELKTGDRILVETSAGTFVYVISSFKVVDRSDQTVIQPTDDPTLTLTTCYPFGNVANTTEAYIVTADLVSSDLKD